MSDFTFACQRCGHQNKFPYGGVDHDACQELAHCQKALAAAKAEARELAQWIHANHEGDATQVDDLVDRILADKPALIPATPQMEDNLAVALNAQRDAVLEEAAKICDELSSALVGLAGAPGITAKECAARIRAAKR